MYPSIHGYSTTYFICYIHKIFNEIAREKNWCNRVARGRRERLARACQLAEGDARAPFNRIDMNMSIGLKLTLAVGVMIKHAWQQRQNLLRTTWVTCALACLLEGVV